MKQRVKGQTLVESALALLVFFMMILGIIDIGQLFYTRYALTGHIRAVARRAAIEPLEDAAIRNLILYGANNDTTRSLFGLTPSNLDIARTSGKLTLAIVNYQAPAVTPWLGGLLSGSRPIVETVLMEDRLVDHR